MRLFSGIRSVLLRHLEFGVAATLPLVLLGSGCDSTRQGPAPLFSQASGSGEKWTIRCMHSNAPGHAEYANQLAELLKKVQGLRPEAVRLASDATGSTIYYGEYTKTAQRDTGRLVFPPEYQRDIQLIRRLSTGDRTPFFYAEPELLSRPTAVTASDGDVRTAKGAYTLQIAVFYNTANFTQREQAAVDYVRLLREQGYPAYFYHDSNRGMSYVFVGDFEASDVITDPNGTKRYGPRVEQFIKRNEVEFRNITENGQIVRRQGLSGKLEAPPSYLVPVPRGGGEPAMGQPAVPRPQVP